MDRKSVKRRLILLLLAACLLLTGCRARIYGSGWSDIPDSSAAGAPEETRREGGLTETGGSALSEEREETADGNMDEPGGRTKENPESSRKEYDENAAVEVVPGTGRLLHQEGEGDGASAAGREGQESVSRLNDRADETAVQTAAAQEAEKMGADPDAEAAESAMTYYTVLLQDRLDSLFECQRANVYWETPDDHVTVHKSSPEHVLILNAGAYDVSSRLLPENLTVDDGWVVRKNPQVIVKIVDSSVLGNGVSSVRPAQNVFHGLVSREGWTGIDAVRNGQVLLLSREMLETPHLQTAAVLLIAGTANPPLFADVDMDEALRMLTEEAAGVLPAGVYYYAAKEE